MGDLPIRTIKQALKELDLGDTSARKALIAMIPGIHERLTHNQRERHVLRKLLVLALRASDWEKNN